MSEENQPNSKTDSIAHGDCRPVPCSPSDVGPWKMEIPGVRATVVVVAWDDRGFCVVPLDEFRQYPIDHYPEGTRWTRLVPGFPQPNTTIEARRDAVSSDERSPRANHQETTE
jgi:hypothetical protein